MIGRLFRAVCVGGILLSLCIGLADAEEPSTLIMHYVDPYSNPPEVHAYLSVLDGQGDPVEKLSLSSFEAREDGAPVTIAEVVPASGGMAVALAIDVSGSMLDGNPSGIQAAKDAATNLVKRMDAADQVAVFSFSDQVVANLALTGDHGAAINTINQLTAERKNTALYDVCYDATSAVARVQRGRRVVILLTDGEDTTSKLKVEDCLNLARESAVPVYTVGLGKAIDANLLGRIAKLSSGRYYNSPSPKELEAILQDVTRLLKTQYEVRYTSSASEGDHALTISLLPGGQKIQDERRFRMPAIPPAIGFANPVANQEIQGKVTVKPFTKSQRRVVKVEYYVDKTLTFAAEAEPFGWEWDTSKVSAGAHVVNAKVYDAGGQSATAEINVSVKPVPAQAPSPTATAIPDKGPIGNLVGGTTGILMAGVGLVILLGVIAVATLSRRRRQSMVDEMFGTIDTQTEMPESHTQEVHVGGRTQGFDPLSDLLLGKITVLTGGQSGRTFDVYDGDIIGRENGAIRIEDSSVSASHAQLHMVRGQVQIQDLNSLNGVLINNHTKLQGNSAVLQGGERLRLGRTTLSFQVQPVVSNTDISSAPMRPVTPTAPSETTGRAEETQFLVGRSDPTQYLDNSSLRSTLGDGRDIGTARGPGDGDLN